MNKYDKFLSSEEIKFLIDNISNRNTTFNIGIYLQIVDYEKFQLSGKDYFRLELSDSVFKSKDFVYIPKIKEKFRIFQILKINKVKYRKLDDKYKMLISFSEIINCNELINNPIYYSNMIASISSIKIINSIKSTIYPGIHQYNEKVDNSHIFKPKFANKDEIDNLVEELTEKITIRENKSDIWESNLNRLGEMYSQGNYLIDLELRVLDSYEDRLYNYYKLQDQNHFTILFIDNKKSHSYLDIHLINMNFYSFKNLLINYSKEKGYHLSPSFSFAYELLDRTESQDNPIQETNVNSVINKVSPKLNSLQNLCEKLDSAVNNCNDYMLVKCRIEISNPLDIIYEGCPVCMKKDCTVHNKEKMVYFKIKLNLLEDTGNNPKMLKSTFFGENAQKLMRMEAAQWKIMSAKKKQENLENISKCLYLVFVHIKFKQKQLYFENNYRVLNIEREQDT